MPDEAPLEETESGLQPGGEGWYVLNVADSAWAVSDAFGSGTTFENREFPFKELGINISVMLPGQPLCLYHGENAQEDFLVLAGECVLLVEGEERPLKAWDFVHSPPWTEHVIVGAGDGPSIVLAVGTRPKPEDDKLLYPKSELAERYGASAEEETPSPQEAYARFDRPRPARPDYWDELPWASG
jgi:uncharacterized cupin superfamily protein